MTRAVTITGVEAIPVVVQGTRSFRISEGQTGKHVSVILRLLTNEPGLEGIAEIVSAPPGKPEEFAEEIVAAVRRYATPAVVGVAAWQRSLAMARLEGALKGRPWTKAGINVALYDLEAKALGVPVSDLLGGRRSERIPVIGPVIGILPPDDMARQAAAQLAAGYGTIKIKIGESLERDIARVAAVRQAVGGAAGLRVDANDHYQPAEAIRLIRAIERYEAEHVEQPVARGDLLGLAEVRRSVGVPIMTDDAVATPQEAMTVVRLGAADRVKVKVTKHGLDGAQLIIGMLEAAGIPCVLGHVFEMGLAAAAEAQLAASARNLVFPCEIGSLEPIGFEGDVIQGDLRPEPGYIRLPDGPGLGVDLDWATIDRFRACEAA
ncbi:MAG: mandelate racemase/muconate lactonizing enzyme family protein [Pseudomonadota bacterium]